jgi:hypothetical protein
MTNSTGKVLEVGTHLRDRAMVRGWLVADGNSVRSRRRAHYGRRWLGEVALVAYGEERGSGPGEEEKGGRFGDGGGKQGSNDGDGAHR